MAHRNAWIGMGALALGALLTAGAGPARADDSANLEELGRKVQAVIEELERMRIGEAPERENLVSRLGFGPAASKVYGAKGASIGGYGEMLYSRDDEAPASARDRLDFLRQVLYVGYTFDPTLHFNSEVEIEHAGVSDVAQVEVDTATGEGAAELSGEVVLEFAYVDWAPRREIGVRAGMMLVPVGMVNELHEPTVFLGARRPDVDQRVIPTTWSGNGIGVFGETESGFSYRAYLVEGLDGRHFSATGGIRDGRQGGSQSNLTKPAATARIEFAGVAGLVVGASGFTGGAWQVDLPPGATDAPSLTLVEAHARAEWRGVEVRVLHAASRLAEAGPISDALGLVGAARLGERATGSYVEASYDVLQALRPDSRWRVAPYARLERLDTQNDVPGGSEDPAAELKIVVAGATLQPHPNVTLKADREWRRDGADVEATRWNVALGYVF